MTLFEWCFLIVAIVTEVVALVILFRALSPTERLHARKMQMLQDISGGVGRDAEDRR